MRNIWRIIKADARSLFTHFFALAVALVIAVLPSLYAWLNIYSNWDPYGNTGNISIAVASLDKGWTEEDGTQVNKGREVVDDLRTSTSINWVAVDTKEEAEHGVYAGDYYAAVVIGEDFSYNMYHMLTEWTGKPTITYYENYKKNAVATKITDTAVSSLKTTISKSYLDVVVDAVFRGANDLSDQLKGDDPVGSVQGLLGQARSLLRSCAQTVDAFQAAGQDNSSYRQDLSDLVANINQNRPDSQELLDTVAQLNRQVHAALDKAQAALDKAFDAAEKILNGIDMDAQLPQIQEDLRDAAQTMDDMGDKLTAWAYMPEVIKNIAFQLKGQFPENMLFVAGIDLPGKPNLAVMLSDDLVARGLHAGNMVREAAKHIQGGGGGQPHFATAGGKNADGLNMAVEAILQSLNVETH